MNKVALLEAPTSHLPRRYCGGTVDFTADVMVCGGVDFSGDDIRLIRGSERETVQVTMSSNKSLN